MQYRDESFECDSTQECYVDLIDFLADLESDYDEVLDLEDSGYTDATTLVSRCEEQNDTGFLFGEINDDGESSTPVMACYSLNPRTSIMTPQMSSARRKSSPETFLRQIDDSRHEEPTRRKSTNSTMPISFSTCSSRECVVDHKVCFDLALFQSSEEQMRVPKVPERTNRHPLAWSNSSNHFLGAAPLLTDNLGEEEDLNELTNLNNETVASSTVTQSEDCCSMSKSSVETGRKRCRRKEPVEKEYVTITDKDVLLGRGGYCHHHPGNKSYRKLILENQKLYKKLENNEKTALSMKVVAQVKESGGRFLKRDEDALEQMYYIVHDVTARLKVSQALREDHTPDGRRLKKERTSAYLR